MSDLNAPSMFEGVMSAGGQTPNEIAAAAEAMFKRNPWQRARAMKFWPKLQHALHARLINTGHVSESYQPFEHGVRFIYLSAIVQKKTVKQAYLAGIGAVNLIPPAPKPGLRVASPEPTDGDAHAPAVRND